VVDEEDLADRHARKIINFRYVLPGYFEAMDIPVLQGRGIRESDRGDETSVAVISESAAQRNWPGQNPIGHRISTGSGLREIVGVVANTREASRDESDTDMVYFSALQTHPTFMDWAIEAEVPLATLLEPVRAELRSLDPTIPAHELMPLDDLIDEGMGGDLIMAKIMSVVALIALILSLGGVYGVMGYSVAQRTQEMGIRMSLGAGEGMLLRMVLIQGVKLALIGIIIGVAVALVVTRSLSYFLFGVNPFDPLTFTTVSVLLFSAGVAATILPARRATRVDPVEALRTD
jgi:predicted permease